MAKLASLSKFNPLIPKTETPASPPSMKTQATSVSKWKIRLATIGLLFVLISFTSFLLWIAYTNHKLVQQATYSNIHNDFFDDAHFALSEENSFVNRYRLKPSPELKDKFYVSASALVTAVNASRTTGNANDQALIDEILTLQQSYTVVVNQIFAAVDANDKLLLAKIDKEIGDNPTEKLEELMNQAVIGHKEVAADYLAKLYSTQNFVYLSTPFVLLVGIGLIVFFWHLLKNYRQEITKDKLVNERLRAINETMASTLEKEKELSDLKSRFVSMTSHEFRTPLTGILTCTELLETYGQKLTEQKKTEVFARIKMAITNMTRLLDDVLVISKAQVNKLEFNPVMLDLTQFCSEIAEEMQLCAGSKNIINFVSAFPNIVGKLDESLLRHILTNLLSNAVKYSPKGGMVNFELKSQAGQAVIQVKDQGIGIPQEDQSRLFENFHRARNVNTIPGTGLGLSIVKQAVDLHGGQITFSSEVGAGTNFTVQLPLGVGAEPLSKMSGQKNFYIRPLIA